MDSNRDEYHNTLSSKKMPHPAAGKNDESRESRIKLGEDDSWTITDLSNPDVPAPWKPLPSKRAAEAPNNLLNIKKVDNPDIKKLNFRTPKKIVVDNMLSPDSSLTDMESPPDNWNAAHQNIQKKK